MTFAVCGGEKITFVSRLERQ